MNSLQPVLEELTGSGLGFTALLTSSVGSHMEAVTSPPVSRDQSQVSERKRPTEASSGEPRVCGCDAEHPALPSGSASYCLRIAPSSRMGGERRLEDGRMGRREEVKKARPLLTALANHSAARCLRTDQTMMPSRVVGNISHLKLVQNKIIDLWFCCESCNLLLVIFGESKVETTVYRSLFLEF